MAGVLLRGSSHDAGDAAAGVVADAHLLSRFSLPLRVPGHLDRAVRIGRGRRVFLPGRRVARRAVLQAGGAGCG